MTHKFEEIEKYLNKTFSQEERVQFEQELENSERLRQMLKHHQQARGYLKDKSLEPMKDNLKKLGRQLIDQEFPDEIWYKEEEEKEAVVVSMTEETVPVVKPFWKKYGPIAAVILVLLLGVWWSQRQTNTNLSLEQLAINNLDNQETLKYMRSDLKRGEDKREDKVLEAFDAFEDQDYARSLSIWDSLIKEDENLDAILHAGICNLFMKRSEAALDYFKLLEELETNEDKVSWYSALAYLLEEDCDNAIKQLERTQDYPLFKKKSEKIIDGVKSNCN